MLQQSVPQKQGIPIIGTIPSVFKLRKPVNPYAFYIGVGNDAEIAKIVEHIATLGIRRVGIVTWPDPSSMESTRLVEQQASMRKVEVIVKALVEVGTSHVGPALAAVKNAKPDAIIVFLPADATGAFVKGLREAKDAALVYGLSSNESMLLTKFAGANNARGVGISQVVPNPFFSPTPLMKEYQENMKRFASKGTQLSSLSFEGYIAAKILVEGIRRAGPIINGKTVKAGLEKLHNVDLGGLLMNYDPENHVALKFLDISVVGRDGRLQY